MSKLNEVFYEGKMENLTEAEMKEIIDESNSIGVFKEPPRVQHHC